MKLRHLVSVSVFCALSAGSVYAAKPGAYIGAGAGYSSLNDFSDATKKNDGGAGGQIFAGYNFNQFFGLEASYRAYADTSYYLDEYPNVTFDYTMKAWTLVGKLYLPLGESSPFNIYGLLGASNVYGDGTTKSPINGENLSASNRAWLATAGFGLTYDINSHVTTGFEYSYTSSKNGNEDNIGIPESNLVTLNLSYNFG
jgi:OOP family OmpA-OmpF porin